MEVIFLFRCLMEKYREACKDFHMILFSWRKLLIENLERLYGGF